MFKNYFILNRIVYELNEILAGQKIQEAYSQDKNRLYLRIATEEFPNRHLIISLDQNFPFLSIKNEHHKAKKNTFTFLQDAFPTEIVELEMSETDRCIRINLSYNTLIFFIRGNKTNIIFVDVDNTIVPFKKISDEEKSNLNLEFSEMSWTSSFNFPDFSELESEDLDLESIRKSYPYLGSEIIREMKLFPHKPMISDLTHFLTDIATKRLSLFYSDELSKYTLVPETSLLLKNADEVQYFEKGIDAINKFVISSYKISNENISRKEISKHLDKELSNLANKLNKLRKRVEDGSKEEEYKHLGSLLLANLHQIKKGQKSIEIYDYLADKNISVALKEKISPNKNVDYYFEKSKDEKINYQKSRELFESATRRYEELIAVKDEFEKAETTQDLEKIKQFLKLGNMSNKPRKMEEQIKYRGYTVESKYSVFVGKDNRNNDLVTFKLAKQNDIWFHARGVPGSHVVLRVDNTKEVVPKNIIKKVAALAAYYSKAKTAGTVPVAYTFRKFVRKKKGMEPGKVILEKESVILVKPEIPIGCEPSED